MTWTFVLREAEMQDFSACRRAWDLGARVRRNLLPRRPAPFDFDLAVHAGLAGYYFPAMDDWNRSIVRPLAARAFHRVMREGRLAYEEVAPFTPEITAACDRYARLGDLVLHRFFAFAAAFDDFDSVMADQDIWVPVPDPRESGRDLGTPDGRAIRYLCRLDQLIADGDDEWWVVTHRLAWGEWAPDPLLLADLTSRRTLWAIEVAYPQLHIAGTVTNELLITPADEARPAPVDSSLLDRLLDGAELDRRDMTAEARHANLRRSPLTPEGRILGAAVDRPDIIVHRECELHVRRTWIRRGRGDLHLVGLGIADEAQAMIDPRVTIAPSPDATRCGRCAFLNPCLVLEEGGDAEPLLAARYRQREPQEFDEAGLRYSSVRLRDRASLRGARMRREQGVSESVSPHHS